jgi:hypothetical protein
MKKNRDEAIGVIIHIYLELSLGNSFISNKQKCHFLIFFFYKIREQEEGTCPAQGWGERLIPVEGGRLWRKVIGGWIWYKKYAHMYVNAKMITVEIIAGMGGG